MKEEEANNLDCFVHTDSCTTQYEERKRNRAKKKCETTSHFMHYSKFDMTNLSMIVVYIFSTSFRIFWKGWRIFLIIGFLNIFLTSLVGDFVDAIYKTVSITFIDSNLVADCFLSGFRSCAIIIAGERSL